MNSNDQALCDNIQMVIENFKGSYGEWLDMKANLEGRINNGDGHSDKVDLVKRLRELHQALLRKQPPLGPPMQVPIEDDRRRP
jgi:hypothetical protein